MDVVNLIKSLSLYTIKEKQLQNLIFGFIEKHLDNFSLKMLEMILWSLSRKHLAHHPDGRIMQYDAQEMEVITKLVDLVKVKSASMKARGVAFAVEAISNLGITNPEVFERFERVILAKLSEFNSHYTAKVLSIYMKQRLGSAQLFDELINHLLKQQETLKYSDLLKFFEVYPEITYIFDNTMSAQRYD